MKVYISKKEHCSSNSTCFVHYFKGLYGHAKPFFMLSQYRWEKMNSVYLLLLIQKASLNFFLNSHQTTGIHQQHSNLLIFYLGTLQIFIKLLRLILSQATQTCLPTANSSCIVNKLFSYNYVIKYLLFYWLLKKKPTIYWPVILIFFLCTSRNSCRLCWVICMINLLLHVP